MRLLEYQAKELFKEFGIKTPPSFASTDIEKGRKDAKELGYPFVSKFRFQLVVEEKQVEFKNVIVMMNLR